MSLPSPKRTLQLILGTTLVMGGFLLGAWSTLGREEPPPVVPRAQAAAVRPAEPPPVPSFDPPLRKEKTPIIRVVEAVSPSVVTVGAVKRTIVRQPWMDSFFFPSWRYYESQQRVPYMGSGFLVDAEGLVLTNHHVIEESVSLFVTFPDGREFPAQLVEADPYIDLALLRFDPKGEELPAPLPLGESDTLMIGEQVMAFGNPFGNLIEDAKPSVTVGYVSALRRDFRPDSQTRRVYQGMIQTDAAINPGNSGGPLVDLTGQVIGINTFIFSQSGTSSGISFALPIRRVRAFLDEVKEHGRLRSLLLDFDVRGVRGPQFAGVQIIAMDDNGPAMDAGLKVGDVITQADGKPVVSREEFRLVVSGKQIGESIQLRLFRNGTVVTTRFEIREAVVPDPRTAPGTGI